MPFYLVETQLSLLFCCISNVSIALIFGGSASQIPPSFCHADMFLPALKFWTWCFNQQFQASLMLQCFIPNPIDGFQGSAIAFFCGIYGMLLLLIVVVIRFCLMHVWAVLFFLLGGISLCSSPFPFSFS